MRQNHYHALKTLFVLIGVGLILGGASLAEDQGQIALIELPDIHKDTVVFVYGGDIRKVNKEGGIASPN